MTRSAELVLLELSAQPATPITSAEMSHLLCGALSPHAVGAAMRELRVLGLAEARDRRTCDVIEVVPPGVRAEWSPTDAALALRAS